MNRRDFLTSIGLTGASLVLVPPSLLSIDNLLAEEFRGYPPLYFTGLKASQTSTRLAGQFLWCTLYENDVKQDIGHWMCNVTVDLYDIRGKSADEISTHVRHQLIKSALTVERMMDGILADASKGLADLGKREQIPNPDFDPSIPESDGYDDDLAYNPRTINGDPIKEPVKRIRLISWNDAGNLDLAPIHISNGRDFTKLWKVEYPPTPSWDIDEVTREAMMSMYLRGRG